MPGRSWCEVALDAGGACLELRFGLADQGSFWVAVEELKDSVPARHRRWDPSRKLWHFQSAARPAAMAWVQRWFTLEQRIFRDQPFDRWESARPGSTESGPPPDPRAAAFAALHLLPSAPAPLVKAAYRCLSQLHHPDHQGGDTAQMTRLNLAYETLTKELAA